jgi:hypothetical protein
MFWQTGTYSDYRPERACGGSHLILNMPSFNPQAVSQMYDVQFELCPKLVTDRDDMVIG